MIIGSAKANTFAAANQTTLSPDRLAESFVVNNKTSNRVPLFKPTDASSKRKRASIKNADGTASQLSRARESESALFGTVSEDMSAQVIGAGLSDIV